MATSGLLQAAMQQPAAKQPTSTDAQNAAVLASIAAPHQATPQQTQTASNAVANRIGAMDQPAPQAFVSEQNAQAAAPQQLANQIAGEQSGAKNAYLGALSSGTANYMSQMQAAMPLVNALASAQVAQANNNYSLQQSQNNYDQNNLAYQNQVLQQTQANPALYGNTQQQAVARQQVVQQANSDTTLSADDKAALNGAIANAYDYPGALSALSGAKSSSGKPLNTERITQWLNSYYGGQGAPGAVTPAASPVAGALQAQSAPKSGSSGWDFGAGLKMIGSNLFNGA